MSQSMNFRRGPSEHADVRTLGARDRRRMYRHLLTLEEEEGRVKALLELLVEPRLSVVDEERVTILRPRDRARLANDPEMRAASEEEETQAHTGWEEK